MSTRNNKDVGKVGFVASAFDLLHAGHIKMLEDAKAQCDYLIASLQSDPTIDKNYRDNPDIRILGSDWEKKPFTGYQLPIPIYFHNRNHPWSTSDLRKRVYEAEKEKK